MLLAIDVSNTHTKLGLFAGTELAASFRVSSDRSRTGDEIGVLVASLIERSGQRLDAISAVAIASVVPTLRLSLEDFVRRYIGCAPYFIEAGSAPGLEIAIDRPSEVGADRIVNAVAAFELFGGPAIVVDFGTATTFDVIARTGAYQGGVIAPGLLISAEALYQRAARLPLVAVERPARVIGRNTVECMQSGLFHGYVGLVEGLIDRIVGELGERAAVVATGGHADVLARESRRIERVEPALTLIGIRLLHEHRQGRSEQG